VAEREPWLKPGMAAIVTGASSGIGLAIARRLLRERVTVIGLSRGGSEPELGAESEAVRMLHCDVREEEAVKRTVRTAFDIAGRIDILVNAAGVSMPQFMNLETIDYELWKRLIDTNLSGLFLVTRATLPHLKKQGGYIINILSTAAFRSSIGNAPYSASKQGAKAIGDTAALEGKEAGVRVTSISPGPVNTAIWSHKTNPPDEAKRAKMLSSEDIADIALFLLSSPSYMAIDNVTVTPFLYG